MSNLESSYCKVFDIPDQQHLIAKNSNKLKIDKTTAYVFEDFDEEGDN